jgi:hypothetical protein
MSSVQKITILEQALEKPLGCEMHTDEAGILRLENGKLGDYWKSKVIVFVE